MQAPETPITARFRGRLERLPAQKRLLLEKLLPRPSAQVDRPTPRTDRSTFPLSYAQERMWFLQNADPASPAYNMPGAVRITGPLQPSILEASLREIVCRHEVLRMRFVSKDGIIVQELCSPESFRLPIANLEGLPREQQLAQLNRLRFDDAKAPFDLGREPPYRCMLVRLAEQESYLLLNLHHITGDGWSFGVLMHELLTLYESFCLEINNPLPPLTLQYADFAAWERKTIAGERLERLSTFWKNKLGDATIAILQPLPPDQPPLHANKIGELRFSIDSRMTQSIRQNCERYRSTIFAHLLCTLKILLYLYTGNNRVAIATPISGRQFPELESLIGLFLNTAILQSTIDPDTTFACFLREEKSSIAEALAHSDLPFQKIVEEMRSVRDLRSSPLFQIMATIQKGLPPASVRACVRFEPLPGEPQAAKFELTVNFIEFDDHIEGLLQYDCALFPGDFVQQLSDDFLKLIARSAADPCQSIRDIPPPMTCEANVKSQCASAGEQSGDLLAFFPGRKDAARERIALIDGPVGLTYADLFEKSNRLATLLETNFGTAASLLILTRRPDTMIVSTLAALQLQAGVVALDPNLPHAALLDCLGHFEQAMLVTDQSISDRVPVAKGWLRMAEDLYATPSSRRESPLWAAHQAIVYPTLCADPVVVKYGQLSSSINSYIAYIGAPPNPNFVVDAPCWSLAFLHQALSCFSKNGTLTTAYNSDVRSIVASLVPGTIDYLQLRAPTAADLAAQRRDQIGPNLLAIWDTIPTRQLSEALTSVFPQSRIIATWGSAATAGPVMIAEVGAGANPSVSWTALPHGVIAAMNGSKVALPRGCRGHLHFAPRSAQSPHFLDLECVGGVNHDGSIRVMTNLALPTNLISAGVFPQTSPAQQQTTQILERRLLQICAQALDVSPITPDSDFFDLGATSMKLLGLIDRINRELKCSLLVSDIFQNPSVRRLARLLEPADSLFKTGCDSRQPIIIFPDISGSTGSCSELLNLLGSQFRFVRTELPTTDALHPAFIPLEQTAQDLATRILSQELPSPAILLGWSAGGILAFETCRILANKGHPPSTIILLDSRPFVHTDAQVDFSFESELQVISEYFGSEMIAQLNPSGLKSPSLWQNVLRIVEANPQTWMRVLRKKIKRHWPVPDGFWDLPPQQWLRILNTMRGRSTSFERYFPPHRIDAPLLVFKSEFSPWQPLDWAAFTAGPVTVALARGDHFSMLKHPQVLALAEQMKQNLRELMAPNKVADGA